MSCQCTDDRPFPQPYESISLTDWVEFIRVDDLFAHATTRNQFQMIRHPIPAKRLKEITGAWGIFESDYNPYQKLSEEATRIKLKIIDFDTLTQPQTTFFFVNKNITAEHNRIENHILDIWRTRAGANTFGSVYFPSNPTRFPYQMPSRGITFR